MDDKITNPALSEKIRELGGIDFMDIFLSNLITLFLIAAAVVALFVLIIGGIKWTTSGGDREQAAQARKTVTSGLIGLGLVFSAYAILNLIGYFFDIDLVHINLKPLMLTSP